MKGTFIYRLAFKRKGGCLPSRSGTGTGKEIYSSLALSSSVTLRPVRGYLNGLATAHMHMHIHLHCDERFPCAALAACWSVIDDRLPRLSV